MKENTAKNKSDLQNKPVQIETHDQGVVLGITRKSAFDRLPPEIKVRREAFMKEAEQGIKEEKKREKDEGDALFYSHVEGLRQRFKAMNEEKKKSRFSKQNIRALVLCAALFASWMVWNRYFGPDDTELSLDDLRSHLPLSVDQNTKITAAADDADGLHLLIEKTGNEYANLSDDEAAARKDAFLRRARALCRNELFSLYVRSGKTLHVLLKTDDGRPDRSISVDKCPVSPSAG